MIVDDIRVSDSVTSPEDAQEIAARVLNSLPKEGVGISVIVPLHNEAEILYDLVNELVETFSDLPSQTEIVLCENGSTDDTKEIAERLSHQHLGVRLLMISRPSYGGALRKGIEEAHADLVVIFNADLWCKRFLIDAVLLLQTGHDIVVGSKRLRGSHDQRPALRRFITAAFNTFLHIFFGFKGTDTHGMKALRRSRVLDVMRRCVTSAEVFDTEMILRAQRASLSICEIPVEVHDLRPARLSLLKRVPSTLRDLWLIRTTL